MRRNHSEHVILSHKVPGVEFESPVCDGMQRNNLGLKTADCGVWSLTMPNLDSVHAIEKIWMSPTQE